MAALSMTDQTSAIFPVREFIEHILGEGDPLPSDIEAEKFSRRGAVEGQPARDARGLGDQQLNPEGEVGDLPEVPLQHPAIARQPDPFAIVAHLVVNELAQPRPVLGVQAGEIGAVEVG